MKRTYYDTWPEARAALDAAALLHLSIEFRNVFCPELGTGIEGMPEGVTTGGLFRYELTVDTEDPPAQPGWDAVEAMAVEAGLLVSTWQASETSDG